MSRMKSLFTEERLYGNLVTEQEVEGFKTKAEGDAFRKWVNDTHPEYAKEIDLDTTGSHNNSFIKKALAKYGTAYKTKDNKPSVGVASVNTKDEEGDIKVTDAKTTDTEVGNPEETEEDKKKREEEEAKKKEDEEIAAKKVKQDALDKELSGGIDFADIDRKIKRGVIQDKRTAKSDNKDQVQEKFKNCKETIKKVSRLDSGKRSVSIDEYVGKGMVGASEGAIAKKASDFKKVISGCLSNKDFGGKLKGQLSDEWIKNNGITVSTPADEGGEIFPIKEKGRTIGKIKKLGDNEYRLIGGPQVAFLKPKSKKLWTNKIPAIVAAIGKTGSIEKTSKGTRGSKDRFDFKVV